LDKAVGFQLNQLSRNFVHVLQKHGQILIIWVGCSWLSVVYCSYLLSSYVLICTGCSMSCWYQVGNLIEKSNRKISSGSEPKLPLVRIKVNTRCCSDNVAWFIFQNCEIKDSSYSTGGLLWVFDYKPAAIWSKIR
jgi:hypothetical protein